MSQKQSAIRLKRLANRSLNIFLGFTLLTGTVIYIQSSVFSEVKNEVIGIAHIQENSLIGISNPCYISEKEKEKERAEKEKEKAIEILLAEIIKRESGGNPTICNKDGCGYGMGSCQIISSTWNSSLERMEKDNIYMPEYCWQEVNANVDKDHPIYNPECHLIVCKWLLRTDGIRHWDSNGEWWGSGPYDLDTLDKIKIN